ncbi:VirK/YbjX family protein [Massilia sp. MS-15]|nr:VirK/YbjX family protein [Massilia sp. MS-15]
MARGLSVRERVQSVLAHYRFEDARFGGAYHQAVHGGSGLTLWRHEVALDHGHHVFSLRLQAPPRGLAEGEGGLAISLLADGRLLHRLSYSWVDGALAGAGLPTVPFITGNDGRWHDAGAAFAAFEQAFPNNSPSFFCFAALQGLAQALGIVQVAAIKCAERVTGDARDPQQAESAYDGFWRILGGVEQPGRAYLIHLPFYLKPLADMPSRHRKRAAQRRACWRAIGDAARGTLLRHLAPAARPRTEAQAAPATAQA